MLIFHNLANAGLAFQDQSPEALQAELLRDSGRSIPKRGSA